MNQILNLYLLDAQACCLDILTTICESLFELHPNVFYICHKNDIVAVLTVKYRFYLFNVE